VKLPEGVAYVEVPVETGQEWSVFPSRVTVSVCVDLSTLMISEAEAAGAAEDTHITRPNRTALKRIGVFNFGREKR
jgi:hypothetical protein